MTVFKGMFDLLNKTRQQPLSEKVAMMRDTVPILDAEALLATEKRQQILQEIRQLLNFPEVEYRRVFFSVIRNFAEFVQNLPETERSYYSSAGGWLDHALERTALSLLLCRTYLLPEEATMESLSSQEMLWVYAVFTAALVYDIGKIIAHHVISLTDSEGNVIDAWQPFGGPMIMQGQATHYMFGFSEEHHDHLRHMVTPLLARQILPPGQVTASDADDDTTHYGGFNWIASDSEVLEAWLALLSDETRQVGSILTVIRLADAQLLEGYFSDRKVFRHTLSPQTIALLAKLNRDRKDFQQKLKELQAKILAEQAAAAEAAKTPSGMEKDKKGTKEKYGLFGLPLDQTKEDLQKQVKTAVATHIIVEHEKQTVKETLQKFLEWLHHQVDKKAISYEKTDAPLKISHEGVILTHQLLEKFASEQKMTHTVTAQHLEQILRQSQLVNPVFYMQILQREGGATIQPGLLVNNPYLVFPNGPPPLVASVQVVPPLTNVVQNEPAPANTQQTYEVRATQSFTFNSNIKPGNTR